MALYNQIRDDIFHQIEIGRYREGEAIPSEIELAGDYHVSRSTIRQALQLLADEGYLERRKRRGTIVTRPKVDQFAATGIRSFEEEQANVGRKIKTTVINFKRERANAEVMKALGLHAKAEVYRLVRLRYVDDRANVFVEEADPTAIQIIGDRGDGAHVAPEAIEFRDHQFVAGPEELQRLGERRPLCH